MRPLYNKREDFDMITHDFYAYVTHEKNLNAYSVPFFCTDDALATRQFVSLFGERSDLSYSTYTLYCIGKYSFAGAKLQPLKKQRAVTSGLHHAKVILQLQKTRDMERQLSQQLSETAVKGIGNV